MSGSFWSNDIGLKALGLCLAVGLSFAAAIEISGNDGTPKINGLQHLAIFAQPAKMRDERLRQARPGGDVDYDSTASISEDARRTNYELKWVERDRAVYDGPKGPFFARIGDEIPGIGRLSAIVKKDGQWTAVHGDADQKIRIILPNSADASPHRP